MASRGRDGCGEVPGPGPNGFPVGPPPEPYPDHLLGDLVGDAQGPDARYSPHESISLVFVAALQHLPPWWRAALVLCDVFGFRLAEAAEILDSSADKVNAALVEARARIADQLPPGWRDRPPPADSAGEREVAHQFADAFERGDADGILALLTDDAWLATPPLPFGYRGRAAAEFLSSSPPPTPGGGTGATGPSRTTGALGATGAFGATGGGTAAAGASEVAAATGTTGEGRDVPRQFRLVATRANGQPAFGCYLCDPAGNVARAHSLLVLTVDGDRVSGITRFKDDSVLRSFGLAITLSC